MADLLPAGLGDLIPTSILAQVATNTAVVAIVASALANQQTDPAALSSLAQLPAIQSVIAQYSTASGVNAGAIATAAAGPSNLVQSVASAVTGRVASGTSVLGTRSNTATAAATSARSAAAGSQFSLGLGAFGWTAGVVLAGLAGAFVL